MAKYKPTINMDTASSEGPLLPNADSKGSIKSQAKAVTSRALKDGEGLNGHRRWRKNHRPSKWSKKSLIIALLVLFIGGGILAGAWDAWQLYHKINHLAVGNLTPSVNGAENILVAGSTNRCNLKVQNAQWGFCSQGVTGVNSDVIFIVHLVPKTGSVSLLSIPRDTFIPNARSNGQSFKIDAALYQGPSQLVKAVEEDYGIPIQHYVEVGFDGFVNIVNAVGGVRMYFPMPVYDSESHLHITTSGCKLLNGVEALQVVRARHLQYKGPGVTTNDVNYWPQENQSDIARISRSHEFLKVLASNIETKGLSDPITDQKLIDAIAPQVQVDSGLSVSSMLQILETFHNVGINNVPQLTLPVSVANFGSYYYGGYGYGDVVFPSEPQDLNTIDQFLGINSSTDPWKEQAYPKPSTIKVNVVNGSGTPYQATDISSGLKSLGFKLVGQPGSITPKSDQAQETIVYYADASKEPQALSVASKLSGYVIISKNAKYVTKGSDITVVTGTAAAVIGIKYSNTNQNSSPSTDQSSIAKPTAANQGLSPWDPRACPK